MKWTDQQLSRRSLLRRTVTGAVGIAAGFEFGSLLDHQALTAWGAQGEYGPFKMSFQSYCLRHFTDTDAFVKEAARLKLPFVELWRGHLPVESAMVDLKRVKGKLFLSGVQVIAFGVEEFTADHGANERLFRLGRALGVENLSANPTKDAFPSLERLVKSYDIKIAIHNHGPEDERWRRPDWTLQAVKNLDPRIGSCADLGHFLRAGVNPIEALEMLGSRVLGCHLKDFDKQGRDAIVGSGRLDLPRTLATLKKIGFRGPLSLEYEGDETNPVPKMLECLDAVRRSARQTT
jgi:sugar phosphate isomerase/epimerase